MEFGFVQGVLGKFKGGHVAAVRMSELLVLCPLSNLILG